MIYTPLDLNEVALTYNVLGGVLFCADKESTLKNGPIGGQLKVDSVFEPYIGCMTAYVFS